VPKFFVLPKVKAFDEVAPCTTTKLGRIVKELPGVKPATLRVVKPVALSPMTIWSAVPVRELKVERDCAAGQPYEVAGDREPVTTLFCKLMVPELVIAPLMVERSLTLMVPALTVVTAPIARPAIPAALLLRVPMLLKVLATTLRSAPFRSKKLPPVADNGPVTVKVPGPRLAMLPLINP
jgi:hypothetical protein